MKVGPVPIRNVLMAGKAFWLRWEKVVRDYLNMSCNDIDYPTMLKVYHLIQQRRPIDRVIRDYNETYFRELMWTLKQKAYGR